MVKSKAKGLTPINFYTNTLFFDAKANETRINSILRFEIILQRVGIILFLS